MLATVTASVVKLHEYSALRELPAALAAFTPVVIVAVYCVFPEKLLAGVKVIVEPLVATEPETELPLPLSLNELVFTVEPLMVSESVADTVALIDTFVAPLDGLTEFTEMYVGAGFDTPPPSPPDGAVLQYELLPLSVQLLIVIALFVVLLQSLRST
ncbi:MAG: hypothetical protein NUV76_09600 [Candidatus Kuenenia sp.]|nr:hypothetical protein [Candidatus Kuenenia sp.]